MKRILDILVAVAGLLVAAPILLVLALAIRWASSGPAIFSQIRLGRDCRPFTCYKLRSMYVGTSQGPTHEVGSASVTPVGAFLRKTKLDELPQLFNVLKGDMSLVGPRPCLPAQSELIAARLSENVFSVQPGITGLAQVLGIDMSDPLKLATVDGEYVRMRTMPGDVKILLATILGSGRGVDRTAPVTAPESSDADQASR